MPAPRKCPYRLLPMSRRLCGPGFAQSLLSLTGSNDSASLLAVDRTRVSRDCNGLRLPGGTTKRILRLMAYMPLRRCPLCAQDVTAPAALRSAALPMFYNRAYCSHYDAVGGRTARSPRTALWLIEQLLANRAVKVCGALPRRADTARLASRGGPHVPRESPTDALRARGSGRAVRATTARSYLYYAAASPRWTDSSRQTLGY
jgi:hypothetical protein